MIGNYRKLSIYVENWQRIATKRNKITHEFSALTEGTNLIPIISPILDCYGNNFIHLNQTKETKQSYLTGIREDINNIIKLNDVIRDFIIINSSQFFKLKTTFPWKNYSLKTPEKQDQECLVYKLGRYFILDAKKIQNDNEIHVAADYIFWKKLDAPPDS